MSRQAFHCPRCGATRCHWQRNPRAITDIVHWQPDDDPADANPVDGYRCPQCGVAIVSYRRWERDDDNYAVDLFEYVPKFCMECGERLEEE